MSGLDLNPRPRGEGVIHFHQTFAICKSFKEMSNKEYHSKETVEKISALSVLEDNEQLEVLFEIYCNE